MDWKDPRSISSTDNTASQGKQHPILTVHSAGEAKPLPSNTLNSSPVGSLNNEGPEHGPFRLNVHHLPWRVAEALLEQIQLHNDEADHQTVTQGVLVLCVVMLNLMFKHSYYQTVSSTKVQQ